MNLSTFNSISKSIQTSNTDKESKTNIEQLVLKLNLIYYEENSISNIVEEIKSAIDRERTERIASDKSKEKNIKYLTNTKTINSLFQYTKEGEYICSSIEDNLNLKNDLPLEIVGKCKFKLIVDNSFDTYITQTIITIPNEEYKLINIFIRLNDNYNWSEWKCITDNATPTIEEIDKNMIHLKRTGVDSVIQLGTSAENPDNLDTLYPVDHFGEYYCLTKNLGNVLNTPSTIEYGFRLWVMDGVFNASTSNSAAFQVMMETGGSWMYLRYCSNATGLWGSWSRFALAENVTSLSANDKSVKELIKEDTAYKDCLCGPSHWDDVISLDNLVNVGNYKSSSKSAANTNVYTASAPWDIRNQETGEFLAGFRVIVMKPVANATVLVYISEPTSSAPTETYIYIRSREKTYAWSSWERLITSTNFNNLDTNTIHLNTYRHPITEIGLVQTATYNNLDNIVYTKSTDEAHEFFCKTSNISVIKEATPEDHFPKTLTTSFRLFDIMLLNQSDPTGVQVIIEAGLTYPSMFIRYYNTSSVKFGDWQEYSYISDAKGLAALSDDERYVTLLDKTNSDLPKESTTGLIDIDLLPVGSYFTTTKDIKVKDNVYGPHLPEECYDASTLKATHGFKLWVMQSGFSIAWTLIMFAINKTTVEDARPLIFVRHSYTESSTKTWTPWYKIAYGDDVGATFMLDGRKATSIAASSDLNNYVSPGNFQVSTNETAATIISTPWYFDPSITAVGFRLMVMLITNTTYERIYQVMFTRHQGGRIYFRTFLGWGWSDWDTIASGTALAELSAKIQTEIKPKLDLKYDDVSYDTTNHKLTLSSTSTNGASKDVDFSDIVNISDKKIGYVTYELNEEDKNYYMTFYDWEDESTRTQIARYKIEGGGGSGGGGTFKVVNRTDWGYYTSVAETAEELDIKFCWSSVDSESVPTGNGVMTIKVNNVQKVKQSIEQYPTTGDPFIFNIKPYLGSGSNTVKVMVEDAGGNSRMMTFTINVISLSITSKFVSSLVYAPNTALSITYNPVGSGTKTIHFDIDSVSVGTTTTAANNVDQEYVIPASKITSGAHIMNIYCTIDVEGTTVSSNILTYSLLVSGGETVIVASPYDRQSTKEQYTTVVIPFNVYNKDSDETTIDITYDNIAYRQIVAQNFKEAVVSYTFKEVGDHVIKILYDNAVKCTFNFTITESSVDVYVETSNREVYLSAQGRSNSEPESTRSVWKDPDTEVDCTLNNFNYNTNGWIELTETDESGVERTIGETVLRINKAASLTVNFKPFEGIASTDPKIKGKTLEFRMAVRDVIDYDAEIISCYNTDTSGNINRGLKGTAKLVLLKGSSILAKTNYKEDEYFTVSIVIANTQTSTKYVVYTYIDGVMCNATPFDASSEYFFQNPGVDIVLGCPTTGNASIDIGRIRIYKADLNRTSVLNNVIADTGNVDDMITSYTHNKVIDDTGAINPQLIAEHAADLPYMYVTGELPPQKGQKTTVSVEYFDNYTASKSFSASGVQMDIQGTSSKDYPRKNYKLKFKNGFDMTESGEHVEKYLLDDSLKATSVFTFKKDFASSEKANNTLISPYYSDILKEKIYKFPKQEEDDALRTAIWGKPIVMFHIVEGQPEFMGCYNFNLD